MRRTARALTPAQREVAAGLVHPWVDPTTGGTRWVIGIKYRHLLCSPFPIGHGGPHTMKMPRMVVQDDFDVAAATAPKYSRRNDAMRGVFVYYEFPDLERMESTPDGPNQTQAD